MGFIKELTDKMPQGIVWMIRKTEVTNDHTGEYDGQIVRTLTYYFEGRLPGQMFWQVKTWLSDNGYDFDDGIDGVATYLLSNDNDGGSAVLKMNHRTNRASLTIDVYEIEPKRDGLTLPTTLDSDFTGAFGMAVVTMYGYDVPLNGINAQMKWDGDKTRGLISMHADGRVSADVQFIGAAHDLDGTMLVTADSLEDLLEKFYVKL